MSGKEKRSLNKVLLETQVFLAVIFITIGLFLFIFLGPLWWTVPIILARAGHVRTTVAYSKIVAVNVSYDDFLSFCFNTNHFARQQIFHECSLNKTHVRSLLNKSYFSSEWIKVFSFSAADRQKKHVIKIFQQDKEEDGSKRFYMGLAF